MTEDAMEMVTEIICGHRTSERRPSALYSIYLDHGIARGIPWAARKRQRTADWGWEQGRPLKVTCPWCGRQKHLAAEDVQDAAAQRVPVVDIALLR